MVPYSRALSLTSVIGVASTFLMTDSAPLALTTPPWQRVETTILSTSRDIRVAYEHCFEPLDLSVSQASLLGYVAENGTMTQTQLAAALVLGRAATGSLVDQLEERGLVQRKPDPDDRRVWLVENTKAGQKLAAKVVKIDEQLRKRIRVGITKAERQQLAELLLKMSANARESVTESQLEN